MDNENKRQCCRTTKGSCPKGVSDDCPTNCQGSGDCGKDCSTGCCSQSGSCGHGGCSSCCKKHPDGPRGKLYCYDWMADVPGAASETDLVEVQFKNTRKGFYHNPGLVLNPGDLVAVEASPGHDIGEVTLMGPLVTHQMRKAGVRRETDIKKIFRLARPADLDKWEEAKAKENDTMIRARQIAADLKLNMKIGDVEYQGDGNKAIFYYIAEERVDFRQLIKVLADTFKVRIEMKQIGARQEAGRIGGIGPCGRPLCCSTWMNNFVSVGTAAARFQDLSLNPQKLAGQCAKLKCCLNFEIDTYVEASKKMPPKDFHPETLDGTFYQFKVDILKREITYSSEKNIPANLVTISAERAFEIMAMNKIGEKPLSLLPDDAPKPNEKKVLDLATQESLTRFDKAKKKKNKNKPQSKGEQKGDKQSNEQAPSADQPGQGAPKNRPSRDKGQPREQKNQQPRKDAQPRENAQQERAPKESPRAESTAPAGEKQAGRPENAEGHRHNNNRRRRNRNHKGNPNSSTPQGE